MTCARASPDAEITIAVFADDGTAVAQQAAAIAGVAHVLRVDHAAHAHALAANIAPQAAALAAGYAMYSAPPLLSART